MLKNKTLNRKHEYEQKESRRIGWHHTLTIQIMNGRRKTLWQQ